MTTREQIPTKGETAIEVIDKYRRTVEDYTRLDPLDVEFTRLTHYLRTLGAGSLYLLYTDDNLAGTFKWRGAFNKVAALEKEGVKEIVVPSAGNHARGAVLAAQQFGMRATIVVPTTAPHAKKEGLRDLWQDQDKLRIIAKGDSFDQSLEFVLDQPQLGTLVHPFDDEEVIAGQGTVADDLERLTGGRIDHIALAVGGAGLLAGTLDRLSQLKNDHTKVHAILPSGSDSLARSLIAGKPIAAEAPNQRYGGSAVRKIGSKTFDVVQAHQNRLFVHHVSDDAVTAEAAEYRSDRHDNDRINTPEHESTSLVVPAALEQIVLTHPGESIAFVATGHNAPLI